jgi:hypothetical protein
MKKRSLLLKTKKRELSSRMTRIEKMILKKKRMIARRMSSNSK